MERSNILKDGIYRGMYFQALRMMRVQSIFVFILIGIAVMFQWYDFDWGVGICAVLVFMMVLYQFSKVNKKIRDLR